MGRVTNRITAHRGLIHLAPALSVDGRYVPRSIVQLNVNAAAYGPATNVSIEESVIRLDRTGAGDHGVDLRPVKMGPWRVEIEAFLDINPTIESPNYGDARWPSIINHVCEFLISKEPNFFLCRGVGFFEGRMFLPVSSGDTIVRGAQITRRFPDRKYGDLNWADPYSGQFLSEGAPDHPFAPDIPGPAIARQ